MKQQIKNIFNKLPTNKNAKILSLILILIFIYWNLQEWWLNSFIYKYWYFAWCDLINYFTYVFIHWSFYHLIFNIIAILSIKDMLKKPILIFIFEILTLSIISTVIFGFLNHSNSILVWFSGIFFWLFTNSILELYFIKKKYNLNIKFIWIILFLNIILLPYLFPQISWLWHFTGVLAWIILFLVEIIFLKLKKSRKIF